MSGLEEWLNLNLRLVSIKDVKNQGSLKVKRNPFTGIRIERNVNWLRNNLETFKYYSDSDK